MAGAEGLGALASELTYGWQGSKEVVSGLLGGLCPAAAASPAISGQARPWSIAA